MEAIVSWGRSNRVSFNESKTQTIRFSHKRTLDGSTLSMAGHSLPNEDRVSLLGVTLSNSLGWSTHIRQVARRASQRLGVLFRARAFFNSQQLFMLYKAQVRPVMEFCSHIWSSGPKSDLVILDHIQRKAVRLIDDAPLTSKLASLSHRRAVSSLSLFYRYYHGLCSDELASITPRPRSFTRCTRGSDYTNPYLVAVPRCRTEQHKNSFFFRTAKLWNSLPTEVFPVCVSLTAFKRAVNKLPLCALE